MHIAIEGCSHGELDIIYKSIKKLEEVNKLKVDLLLCCGDFQSVRNEQDLKCMAVPTKYMKMQDFHKYYSGAEKAPVLTIFIGGNHEASSYLQELPYGGWVAPNIYYLGYAGVVRVGNLRIGGLSGIYKGPDYLKGHYEKSPYSNDSIRSVYHVRNLEVFRLKQLSGNTDIFMSHDWPRGIYHHGNVDKLLRAKKFFEAEIKSNSLGSRPAEDLIKHIKPNFWFSGHLHVKFSAVMNHESEEDGKVKATKFLALDKCLPRRNFLQILEFPSVGQPSLQHDAEWLTILRLTNHLLSIDNKVVYMPGPGGSERYQFIPTPEEIDETINMLGGDLSIPISNFSITASPSLPDARLPDMNFIQMPEPFTNPQTKNLCNSLQVDDPMELLLGNRLRKGRTSTPPLPFNKSEMNITMNSSKLSTNLDEVSLVDDDTDDDLTSGDIVFELRSEFNKSSSDSASDLLTLVSPIRSIEKDTPRRLILSPMSSSPRATVSDRKKSTSPETRSPISSQPGGEGSSTAESLDDEGSPQTKRGSDSLEDEVSCKTIGESSKKFKRRNSSVYSAAEDVV